MTLRNGAQVVLRAIRPEDRQPLAEGFGRLSERSRQLRFLEARSELTDAELTFLTEVDGQHHLAIVCVATDGEQESHGLGVARFIQLPQEPTTAEIAVTVVDSAQGLGIGSLLAAELVQAARALGIEKFRALMISSNGQMMTLMQKIDPGAVVRGRGPEIVVDSLVSPNLASS